MYSVFSIQVSAIASTEAVKCETDLQSDYFKVMHKWKGGITTGREREEQEWLTCLCRCPRAWWGCRVAGCPAAGSPPRPSDSLPALSAAAEPCEFTYTQSIQHATHCKTQYCLVNTTPNTWNTWQAVWRMQMCVTRRLPTVRTLGSLLRQPALSKQHTAD